MKQEGEQSASKFGVKNKEKINYEKSECPVGLTKVDFLHKNSFINGGVKDFTCTNNQAHD